MDMADIDILERLSRILTPFKEATVLMSSQSNCTVSLLRPLLYKLLSVTYPDPQLEDPPLIHEMKAVMYHDLESR